MVACVETPIAAALGPSLRCKANAEHLVRRAPPRAPDAAGFRRCDVGPLAIGCIPASCAAVVATHLNDPRLCFEAAGDPVESVAAEVHDPSTLVEISLKGVEALARPVFRVRSGDNRRIAISQSAPFALEILVSSDVVGDADMLQPFDDVHVHGKMAVGAGQPVRKTGSYVEQRAPAA